MQQKSDTDGNKSSVVVQNDSNRLSNNSSVTNTANKDKNIIIDNESSSETSKLLPVKIEKSDKLSEESESELKIESLDTVNQQQQLQEESPSATGIVSRQPDISDEDDDDDEDEEDVRELEGRTVSAKGQEVGF